MKPNRWVMKTLALLAALVLLAGCSTGSPVAPTPDPLHVQATTGAIQTQAAATVIANLTLNAPTATPTSEPTATATATTEPTATVPPTATEVPATATLQPTATFAFPTWTPVPTGTPAPTFTPTSFKCSITEQSPEFGYDVKVGLDFDASWTIKNTGTTTWQASNVDFRYISGTKMHEGGDARDLGADVAANGTVKLVLDMIAPTTPGRYTATWGLVSGQETLCVFNVTIDSIE